MTNQEQAERIARELQSDIFRNRETAIKGLLQNSQVLVEEPTIDSYPLCKLYTRPADPIEYYNELLRSKGYILVLNITSNKEVISLCKVISKVRSEYAIDYGIREFEVNSKSL